MKTKLATLLLLIATAAAYAGQSVTLAWNANSETNLAGYRLHYGPASRQYDQTLTVNAATTTATATNLVIGEKYFFAVTAFTVDGLESDFSNEVSFGFKPAPPANLRIQVSLQSAATPQGPWKNLWTLNQTATTGAESAFFRGFLQIDPEPDPARN